MIKLGVMVKSEGKDPQGKDPPYLKQGIDHLQNIIVVGIGIVHNNIVMGGNSILV